MATPESWENVTPNWGIRYPKPNAPAQKLPDAFQHMGVDLDDALTRGSLPAGPDTGWITPTLSGGFTPNPSDPPGYRKIGSVVYLRGQIFLSTVPSFLVAFTLPVGFRPMTLFRLTNVQSWAATTQVSQSGAVSIDANTARTTSPGFMLGGIVFPAD